jgi:hypothetical protein
MTFSIKSIDKKILDEIYTPRVAADFEQYIYPKKNWESGTEARTWAVSESADAYVFEVVLADRMDASVCYAFIMGSMHAIVKTVGFRQYAFIQASKGVGERQREVQDLISEALRIGGQYLKGGAASDGIFSVPNAQFINN